MLCDIFKSTNSQHTCNIHKYINQWYIETTVNVETHLGKTTKVLFIWHAKYMAPFCLCTKLHTMFYIFLPYLYRLLYPLMLFGLLSLFFLSLNLLMIHTYPGSTQPLLHFCAHNRIFFYFSLQLNTLRKLTYNTTYIS